LVIRGRATIDAVGRPVAIIVTVGGATTTYPRLGFVAIVFARVDTIEDSIAVRIL
jgi:hypothetical protein